MKRNVSALLVLWLAGLACNAPSLVSNPLAPGSPPTLPPPTATPEPIDLAHQPLYWFAALPPQPGGPYDGSDDYMDLFQPDAPWDRTASYLQVYKLYGGWAARDSTTSQLSQAITAIRQRGLALAVELGPLNPGSDECGLYIEGFAGEEGVATVKRIQATGGNLNLIAFDEPYFYGHIYDGEKACRWPAEKIAQDVNTFITHVRAIYPDLIIGDIEPLTGAGNADAYKAWLDTFRAVNGYDLAFLHLDIDWSNTRWPEEVKKLGDYGNQINVPTGVIFTGNYQDQTDEAWLSIAGERIKRYEATGGQLDHIIFQSWNDKPDRALPESDPYTFTGFIKTYFENKSALGFQAGASDNLALGKSVQVSHQITGNEGQWVVDGDPGTIWNSGDGPPQWIEIDLGAPYELREIRLVVSQYPAGYTQHRVLAKAAGGEFTLLHTFEGETKDSDILVFTAADPLQGMQVIRIETTASPSWISWREIEVLR